VVGFCLGMVLLGLRVEAVLMLTGTKSVGSPSRPARALFLSSGVRPFFYCIRARYTATANTAIDALCDHVWTYANGAQR
jgi:hypothetical protein